jgi:hypothetical protein
VAIDTVVANCSDHLPQYRQSAILERETRRWPRDCEPAPVLSRRPALGLEVRQSRVAPQWPVLNRSPGRGHPVGRFCRRSPSPAARQLGLDSGSPQVSRCGFAAHADGPLDVP